MFRTRRRRILGRQRASRRPPPATRIPRPLTNLLTGCPKLPPVIHRLTSQDARDSPDSPDSPDSSD